VSTTIGVISDTHGLLRPQALASLRGCDVLVHAGDIGAPSVLDELNDIAPVHAVRGNVDKGAWANELPETLVVGVKDKSIYVIHDLGELDFKPSAAGFCAVISGHSHIPKSYREDGVLYFNPGSAGPRRFKLPVSLGKIYVDRDQLETELIELLGVRA
jgi:putative phosphoesterase